MPVQEIQITLRVTDPQRFRPAAFRAWLYAAMLREAEVLDYRQITIGLIRARTAKRRPKRIGR